MKKLTPDKINLYVLQAKTRGLEPITMRQYVYAPYSKLIVMPNLKNAGTVRTYEQVKDYVKGKIDNYTEEMYQRELNDLYGRFGDKFDIETLIESYEQTFADIIKDVNSMKGTEFKIEDYTFEELYEAVKYAGETWRSNKETSPKFYDYLEEFLRGR